jgi:hypothetical protein
LVIKLSLLAAWSRVNLVGFPVVTLTYQRCPVTMITGCLAAGMILTTRPDHGIGIAAGRKLPRLHHDLGRTSRPTLGKGRAAAMTAQSRKSADEEYEQQLRNLVRIASACTLGLWSFAAGLLIGTFYLF